MNLVETGSDGEYIAAGLHVALHTLVVDVELQVFGDFCAAFCDFLRIVAYAGIAAHIILECAGGVVNVAAIVIQNQSPDFVMLLHELGKLMHSLNAFPFGKANASEAFKVMDCVILRVKVHHSGMRFHGFRFWFCRVLDEFFFHSVPLAGFGGGNPMSPYVVSWLRFW